MISLKPDKNIIVKKIKIKSGKRLIPALILAPKKPACKVTGISISNKPGITVSNAPGILWIHGGGYILGMKEMVHMSRAVDLVKRYGAVVISPGYRMAFQKPYPAAIEDCYAALLYLKENSSKLNINKNQIMVGGESAGGGLCAALCMMARDRREVNISYQMPLYPMLDNFDTDSSRDNHGKIWNTRRNHFGWRMYLRKDAKNDVSPYASPSRQTDYKNLPPAYTFVGDGEPFYIETLTFIDNLKKAGVEASVDVYKTNFHAFDMIKPKLEISMKAAAKFNEKFEYAMRHYFAENS